MSRPTTGNPAAKPPAPRDGGGEVPSADRIAERIIKGPGLALALAANIGQADSLAEARRYLKAAIVDAIEAERARR